MFCFVLKGTCITDIITTDKVDLIKPVVNGNGIFLGGVAPPVVPCLHGLRPDKFNASNEIWCIDIHENLPKFTSDNKLSLGELFIGFLHYYTYFNYSCYAISVRAGSKLPIDECR